MGVDVCVASLTQTCGNRAKEGGRIQIRLILIQSGFYPDVQQTAALCAVTLIDLVASAK